MQTTKRLEAALNRLQMTVGTQRQPKLSDKRFDQAHEAFEDSSCQQGMILEWLQTFAAQHPHTGSLRILSIGCGSGILDRQLIKSLATKEARQVEYAAIDPNSVACDRFRVDFESLGLKNVNLDLQKETVESMDFDARFDIIQAVHSVYYFADPATSIDQLLAQLGPKGKLVIFQAPMAELNRLADCFWGHQKKADIWYSERLSAHLQEAGLTHAKTRINGRIDVAPCFAAESSCGEMILDFITQVDCRSMPTLLRGEVKECLLSISEKAGTHVWAPHPVDVFVIDAPPPMK